MRKINEHSQSIITAFNNEQAGEMMIQDVLRAAHELTDVYLAHSFNDDACLEAMDLIKQAMKLIDIADSGSPSKRRRK